MVMEVQPNRLSLGNKVSLITGAQYRYEGVVAAINSIEGTLTLQNVRFCGTENRAPGNTTRQNGENQAPVVGSVFDAITFWMSSIVQLCIVDEMKPEVNDLGDKGVVKAGIALDGNRGRGRRVKNWWPSNGDPQRLGMRNSPNTGVDGIPTIPVPADRYLNSTVSPMQAGQSRMLVSYPRRGRSGGIIPRQASYVPVVPIMPSSGALRRSGYGPNIRGSPYRLLGTPLLPGLRGFGRKPGQPIRRAAGNIDERRYGQNSFNQTGGVFVYLPPEMAAAYQSHGINLVPARPLVHRRRTVERRGASRAPGNAEQEVDCSTPYDFETANAELEAELAKICINAEGMLTTSTSQSQGVDAVGPVNSSSAFSTGDVRINDPCPPSSSLSAGIIGTSGAGNGASGDSSIGAVTSTINGGATESATNVITTNAEGYGLLAKGEYYVREKCFFDQISRSESGPRGHFSVNGKRGPNIQSTYGGVSSSRTGSFMNSGFMPGSGPLLSAATAARRERQLNMETFGPIAARSTFAPRRRTNASLSREFLVSASA
ncbi:hypothetical protein AHF37_05994 [Paragonimus kellicotti]|nr:hypothetical protein AHF37_05994 [Paragonimus kellicotti]